MTLTYSTVVIITMNSNTVNGEPNKIKQWMDSNKLSLNLNKTKAMTFGNYKYNSELQIKIEGVQIENVIENKFLGVIIDNKLSWKAHIRHIRTKVSKTLAIINKAKQFLHQNALRTLYCYPTSPIVSK